MSVGGGGGGGLVKPVSIVYEAQDRITPTLKTIERSHTDLEKAGEKTWAGLSRAIDVTGQRVDGLGEKTEKLKQTLGADLTLAIQGLQQSAGQLSSGIQALVDRSSQLTTVSVAFDRLTQSAGMSSDALLQRLRAATKGTVDDLELMKQANTGAFLAGKEIMDQLPGLFEVAQASAKATGQSVEYLTQSLVTGIGRESKLILDNLGLTINMDQVHQDYARTLGKTTEQLSATERRQALVNEVLRQGAAIIDAAGAAGETMAEKMHSAETSLQNLQDWASKAAGKLPGVSEGLTAIGIALKGIEKFSPIIMGLNSAAQLGGTLGLLGRGAGTAGAAAGAAETAAGGGAAASVGLGAAVPWLAAGIVGVAELEDLLNGLHELYLQNTADETAAQDAQLKSIRDKMRAMDASLQETRKNAARSLKELQDSMLPSEKYTFERFVLGETPEEAAQNLAKVRRAFDDYILSQKMEGADWQAAQRQFGQHLRDIRAHTEAGPGRDKALENEIVKYAQEMRIDPAAALRIAEDEDKRWKQRQQQRTKDRERAAKEEQRAVEQANKEREREAERQRKEAERAQRETMKTIGEARKLAMQDELKDLQERSKALETGIKGWYDTHEYISMADKATVDFSHSATQALDEYAAKAREVAAGVQESGLFRFQLSGMQLSKFGAGARQREAIRDQLGPAPKLDGFVQAQVTPGDRYVNNYEPVDVQRAVAEYEQIQQRIQQLQTALERQPPAVEALRDAFARTNVDLTQTTDVMAVATETLGGQAQAVQETIQPLADAREQFDLAGASIKDVGRSMGRIGLAGSNLKGDLDGAAGAVIDFGTKVGDDKTGAVGKLGAFGTAFDTARGKVGAFRDSLTKAPDGLDLHLVKIRDRLSGGKDSVGAALDTFGIKIGALPDSSPYKAFRQWFDDVASSINSVTSALPGLTNNLAPVAAPMAALAAPTQQVAGAMGHLAGGDLASVASDFSKLGTGADQTDKAFTHLGGSQSPISGMRTEMSNLASGGELTSLRLKLDGLRTDILEKLGTANGAGAFYDVGKGVADLTAKVGTAGTAGTLAGTLNSLYPSAGAGPLGFAITGFDSWKTSTAALASGSTSVPALSSAVSGLISSLNGIKASRTAQNSTLQFPGPGLRTTGAPPWEKFQSILDPRQNYASSADLSDAIRTRYTDVNFAAEELKKYWEATILPTQGAAARSMAAGPALPAGGAAGGGISITLQINNPVLTHQRAVDDLAERISRKLGRQLASTQGMSRLVGRI